MVQDKGCFMYMSTGSLQSYLRAHTHADTGHEKSSGGEEGPLCSAFWQRLSQPLKV